ncbi:hypothetical protein TREMEDRAFT_60930 [Tremella mesenterica DSM 1558]|uniref:uncharacterized protein n=1 Tax=Tremella mesenterica (strain ATCC 24925 / CBS 8224 / DSM 1558 / NBRC 9311 / NRRL Y-6157 / RJB 2259-6 / UBC 559-6) TaxID=578456 RepID=UPI0003F48D81|nr:uncharacterized protein TREMEDRAFT_60930 [Tremella mesenterica DSM 1558]EIW70437.1 hypothetical protein TREMEDRAFT_60930 [Tremella mesenterica DSM 1558]
MLYRRGIDGLDFDRTTHHLSIYPPAQLLVAELNTSAPASESVDFQRFYRILEEATGIPCQLVDKSHWNDNAGLVFLQSLSIPGEIRASVLMSTAEKWVWRVLQQGSAHWRRGHVLAAVSALFKWISVNRDITFPKASLRIRYKALKGTIYVDTETVRNLELVSNAITGQSSGTLYGNFTIVVGCGLTLRRTPQSLSYSYGVPSFEEDDPSAEQHLRSLARHRKLDRTRDFFPGLSLQPMTLIAIEPGATQGQPSGDRKAHRQITPIAIIPVWYPTTFTGALRLHVAFPVGCVSDSSQPSYRHISDGHRRFVRSPEVMLTFEASFDESTNDKSKKGEFTKRTRLYAVKRGQNAVLDIARNAYEENEADIWGGTYNYACRLHWTDAGYLYSVATEQLKNRRPPKEWIDIHSSHSKILFSTADLTSRNYRLKQSAEEVFLLSEQYVARMVGEVNEVVEGLYTCIETVGTFIPSRVYWKSGSTSVAIWIRNGRHPVLEKMLGDTRCVPNDIAASDNASFRLVQGPNMSGKTTYLRQIGLLVVQAMIGCFVPAEYASFKVHDALLSRLSNDGTATSTSLVLIDEPSSQQPGRLFRLPTEPLLTPHRLQELAAQRFLLRPHCIHTRLSKVPGNGNIMLIARVGAGKSDMPPRVGDGVRARNGGEIGATGVKLYVLMRERVDLLRRVAREKSATNAVARRRKTMLDLRGHLTQIVAVSRLNDSDLAELLRALQQRCLRIIHKTFLIEDAAGRLNNGDED